MILYPEQLLVALCRSMVYSIIMIELMWSLHDGISATMKVGGGTSKPFSVRNGLHQECTIIPTLFILYFGLVIYRWLSQSMASSRCGSAV